MSTNALRNSGSTGSPARSDAACTAVPLDLRFSSTHVIAEVPPAMSVRIEMLQAGMQDRAWSVFKTQLDDALLLFGEMAAPYAANGTTDRVSIFMKVRGPGQRVINGRVFADDEIIVLGPQTEFTAASSGPYCWLGMLIGREDLQRYTHAVSGAPADCASGETRIIRVPGEQLDRLRRAGQAVVREAMRSDGDIDSRPAIGSFQRELLSGLMLSLHDSSPPLRSGHELLARRAYDYLRANERDLDATDLCRYLGISERWLREAFARVYGTSPKRFLRLRRLNRAREALLQDERRPSVTSVALAHGFFDLGRFAASYRSLFGESPSATLRRRDDPAGKWFRDPPLLAG